MSGRQRACLLDTTALLAHFRNEPGAEQVQAILDDRNQDVLISAVSITEFASRLESLGASLEATLVHRDPHFNGIPDSLLAREQLDA